MPAGTTSRESLPTSGDSGFIGCVAPLSDSHGADCRLWCRTAFVASHSRSSMLGFEQTLRHASRHVPNGRGSEGGAAMGAAADGPPPSGGAREERVGGAPVEAGDARGASDEEPGAGSTERIIG